MSVKLNKRNRLLIIFFFALLLTGCADIEDADIVKIRIGTYCLKPMSEEMTIYQSDNIDKYQIDVIAFQGVDRYTLRTDFDMCAILQTTQYPHAFFSKAMDYSYGEYGMMTMARYPLNEQSETELYSKESADREVEEEFLALYAVMDYTDLEKMQKRTQLKAEGAVEPRIYQHCIVQKEGVEISFYNIILSHESQKLRRMQIEQLKQILDEDPHEYKVMAGNFNNVQTTQEMEIFMEDYTVINGLYGKWMSTYPADNDGDMHIYSIDNIICSKNIKVMREMTAPENIADHNLFFADLVIARS